VFFSIIANVDIFHDYIICREEMSHMNQEYLSLCEYTVNMGETLGADECEAMIMRTCSTSVTAEMGEVNAVSSMQREELRIRVIKDKAMSSICTNKVERCSVEKAVRKAVKTARSSWKDTYWSSFPSPATYPHLQVWDNRIVQISPQELIEPVIHVLRNISFPIIVHRIAHEVNTQQRACVNSNGICHADCGTQQNFMIQAVEEDQSQGMTPTIYLASYERRHHLPFHLIKKLEENISLCGTRKKAHSARANVILSPLVVLKLFHYSLLGALSGDSVARRKSYFIGKEQEFVASPLFSLHDDGIIEEGTASQEMDDEGVPSQDTPLIEEGVLKGFIWDNYWATRMNKQSTGNAFYNQRTGRMGIRHTNLVIPPGSWNQEELLEGMDGYYIYDIRGAHSANSDTGSFAVTASPAFQVRNGQITGCVVGAMISETIFSLLRKISAVGRKPEVRQDAIFPPVRCEDIPIIAP
jgi:PmbA protein